MNPDARTILFVREVAWRTHFPISTRVLAEHFARDGWNVIWLTPPLPPWSALRPTSSAALHEQYANGGLHIADNIFAYTPRTIIPFSRHFPLNRAFLARWMWSACWPPVQRNLHRAGLPEPDILFISHWTAGRIRAMYPQAPAVYHVTDNYEHYPAVPAATCARMQRDNYRRADHVIVTAPTLAHMLHKRFAVPESRVTVVGHGVDAGRYTSGLPDPLSHIPHPRVVLLGNTAKIDFTLLAGLADALPDIAFVVLGPPCTELESVAAPRANIHVCGAIAPEDVPAHLIHADIGLILLGARFRAAGADMAPMKLFEYACAGLPIAGQWLPIYATLDVPISIFETVEHGVTEIRSALANRVNQGPIMRAFAMQNTWAHKYRAVLDVFEPLLRERAR